MTAVSPPTRRARTRKRGSIVALMVILSLLACYFALGSTASGITPTAPDNRGTDFWLAFPGNYFGGPALTLFVSGDTATTGTVEIPGLSFSQPFTVTPGDVTSVPVPSGADVDTTDQVQSLGIHVTAGAEVSVYGLNRIQYTTDAYLGLPTDILGTSYVVMAWKNVGNGLQSEFAVVATQDATTVTITPSVNAGSRPAGVPYQVTLNQGQTYQLRTSDPEPADLTGTIVTSDKPVGVFGGHQCANVPNGATLACDHVVEEMPPTDTWGKSFVTMPLATRTGGDTFRVLASQANTTVSVNGAAVATIGAGQYYETLLTGPSMITADRPVLVAQYSNGSSFDGVTSDPFMMLIPPYEQFLSSYTVTTPASGFATNYINLVVPSAGVGSVTVDGVTVPAGSFTAIGSSGFSGAQVPVALGAHVLSGTVPFGAFMYGFDSFDSYGYPGGLSLAPVARVTTVSLSPKTATEVVGTQHCLTATVQDQNSAALQGVRVDFVVTGANSASGFAQTVADGTAQFCYTGSATGNDTVIASVGTLSDTAAVTWTQNDATATKVAYTGPGSVQYSDPVSLSGRLTTATNSPLAGYGLGFTLGSQTTSASPTNATGDVTAAPLVVNQQPGSVSSVGVAFAGDALAQLLASSTTAPFTIAREDCTLSYSGDVLVATGGLTTLRAQLGETDPYPGNWAGKSVVFTLVNSASVSQTLTAATDAAGAASVAAALPADVYQVTAAFAGDAYYGPCSAPQTIVTVQMAAAKITGGGWVTPGAGRLSFGFNVAPSALGPIGQVQLNGRAGKDRFHGDAMLTLSTSGASGTFTGTGRWNGASGYRFSISVVDNGTSGKKGDTLSVTITSPGGTVVYSSSGALPLKGGNIVVH